MACTAKQPLSDVFEVMKTNYIEEHRSRSMLDMTPELPYNRCIMPVTNGRCRKIVSGVALTQYCWKHQPGGGICHPGDSVVCSWNYNGILQKNADIQRRRGFPKTFMELHWWGVYRERLRRDSRRDS
jgi:hypothetical protein